jgi:hypothetical protein
MNSDGTGKTKLSANKGLNPDWCPNGVQIAYNTFSDNNGGIWIINADGTNEHMINEEGLSPDWSGAEVNNPPGIPTIIGPTSGKAGASYNYTFISTDPDVEDDEISYYINWGDDTYTDWTRSPTSGQPFNVSHIWKKGDTYIIRAKAKDEIGAESDWATLEVSMPRNKAIRPFTIFLERLMERFPILEQILQPIYDKLAGLW